MPMEGDAQPQPAAPRRGEGYETRDLNVKGVLIFLVVMAASVVGVHIAVRLDLLDLAAEAGTEDRRTLEQEVRPEVAESGAFFPAPREQISPQRDLSELRALEETQLNSYGWVDRTSGVVRIPIQRAMELISQRGLPPTAGNPSSLQLQQQRPVQSTPPSKEQGRQ